MRFSVIIPLYNKGPYVKKAIQSVLDQTFKDYEIIVIDDGSTDDSYEIAKAVLDGALIKNQLVQQENAGVSTARNNGVTLSTGDYICFLDADDWWAPRFLERLDWLICAFPDAGIYGTNYYYVKNGSMRVCVKGAETGYINYCKVYADGMSMPLSSISVGIPRAVFEHQRGFKSHLRFGEDFDLWIRIALSERVVFLNEPLAYYNQDVDPLWRGIGHLVSPEVHMLWNLDYLSEEEEKNPDYKQLIDRLRVHSLMSYYISCQYREAARKELMKVDWSGQPPRIRVLYKLPILVLKGRRSFLRFGSGIKQWLKRHQIGV